MKTLSYVGELITAHRKEKVGHQKQMKPLTGMTPQQYQRLESGADMRLSTLFRVLEALELEMMLVPDNKVKLIQMIIDTPSSELVNIMALMQDQRGLENKYKTHGTSVADLLIEELSDDE